MRTFGTIIDRLKQGLELPTSHENPYLSESLLLSDVLFTQKELDQKKGSGIFSNDTSPLVIEIGCYMGKTIIELAQANPKTHFLGLDITYKRVVKSAKKIKKQGIENGKIAICDGHYFLEHVAQLNSLDGICIFFPDPWLKKKQRKHRLLNPDFVALAHQKLKPGGFIWFRTDCHEYFCSAQEIILNGGFTADDLDTDQPRSQPSWIHGGPFETTFQKLFTAQGLPFYQRVFVKKVDHDI